MHDAAKEFGYSPGKIDKSTYTDPGISLPVLVGDEILSGDSRSARDNGHQLRKKFWANKVDDLSNVCDSIDINGREIRYRLATSSRHVGQSLKEVNMERWNLVNTPSLHATEICWTKSEQSPKVLDSHCQLALLVEGLMFGTQ